jgi:YVTN family beta-propeller protein
MAITPDGKRLFVSSITLDRVSVIDTETLQILGSPINVGPTPTSLAISPDGRFAYVTNRFAGSVSVIDTQAARVVDEILVGDYPESVTFSPGGDLAYVTRKSPGALVILDTHSRQIVGTPIDADPGPGQIVLMPNQAPVASFFSSLFRSGFPGSFDGLASTDPDGQIAHYEWSFGDGQAAVGASPAANHVYASPGTYEAMLSVTDDEGCSTIPVFTGKTAYCNGLPRASQRQAVTARGVFAAIRVRCPNRAERRICRFKLRAVETRKARARAQSALARSKVRRGTSAIVWIRPKARFARKLTTARRILIRGQRWSGGRLRVFVRWFRVILRRSVSQGDL